MFRMIAMGVVAGALSLLAASATDAREWSGGWKRSHGDVRSAEAHGRARQIGSVSCKPVSLQKRDGETVGEAIARLRRSAEQGRRLRSCEITAR